MTTVEQYYALINSVPEDRRPAVEEGFRPFFNDTDALAIVVSLLKNLNPEQLEVAVHPFDGPPILVLGGAGSGKTATLTRRLAYLILRGVPPEGIFAVTFTRKAAREMAERTQQLFRNLCEIARPPYDVWLKEITDRVAEAWITTFHSAGLRLLREAPLGGKTNLQILGYGAYSRIIDEMERNNILTQLLKEMAIDEFRPEEIGGIISNAKGSFIYPEAFHHTVQKREEEIADLVYPRYQSLLESKGLLDFDDLIFKLYELFEKYPEILEHYQDRFQTLLIDEYQDTNMSQYLIGTLLAQKNRRIMVVGDDDQSIYAWRGAQTENMTRFISDYPEIRIVKLFRNYRSDTAILEAANNIWHDKPEQLRKVLLRSRPEADGAEPIRMVAAADEVAEGAYIAMEIHGAIQRGFEPHEIAILVRAHYLLGPVVESLETMGIPWAQAGALKSLSKPEVQGTIALIETAALLSRRLTAPGEWHPGDGEALFHALRSALLGPAMGCDPAIGDQLLQLGDIANLLMNDAERASQRAFIDPLLSYNLDRIAAFAREALVTPEIWMPTAILSRAVELFIPTTDQSDDNPGWRAVKRLHELAGLADLRRGRNPIDRVLKFTEEVHARAGLVADEGETTEKAPELAPAVQLMTLHAAKGLEFDIVFLACCEDGIIPIRRSKDTSPNEQDERDHEEKRLFYVGVSRAKRILHISRCKKRGGLNEAREMPPSPFLKLIPEHLTVPCEA
jgi:DNA helicase-2/ATP-dependent DNA helicase PcrA